MSNQTYHIARDDDAVDRVLDKAGKKVGEGATHYHGMTYEQGIQDALSWVMGDDDDEPLCDCPEVEDY